MANSESETLKHVHKSIYFGLYQLWRSSLKLTSSIQVKGQFKEDYDQKGAELNRPKAELQVENSKRQA